MHLDLISIGISAGRWLADRKSKKDDNEMSAELKMLQSLDHEAQHAQAAIQYPEPKDIDKTGEANWYPG